MTAKPGADSERPSSTLKKIVIPVVVALLAGGSAPWWWHWIFPAPPSPPPPDPACSSQVLEDQLLRAGTGKPSVIISMAQKMKDKFSQQKFQCVTNIARVLLQDDQDNGHALYYSGEIWRVRATQEPSHADSDFGRMREYFYRYLEADSHLPLDQRNGDASACYRREKGFCTERTAWIDHLMAIDFYRRGLASMDQATKAHRFRRALDFVNDDLKFRTTDQEKHIHKGFEQTIPSSVLKYKIQNELKKLALR